MRKTICLITEEIWYIFQTGFTLQEQNFTSTGAPGRVAQSVGHLTRKSGVLGSIPGLATYLNTFVSSSADSRRAVVSYWRKYVHKVLVNCLGGLSLPRKSVVRLTDHPDMTLDVYRGCKTTTITYRSNFFPLRAYSPCKEKAKKKGGGK